MLSVFKWLWNKSEERAMHQVLVDINSMSMYHRKQAEIAYFKDKYEPTKGEHSDLMKEFLNPKLTAKEHECIARALEDLANSFRRVGPDV